MRLRITTPEIKFIDHALVNNVAIGFEMAKHTKGEKFSKNLKKKCLNYHVLVLTSPIYADCL